MLEMTIDSNRPESERGRAALLDLYRLALDADEPAIMSTAIELAVDATRSAIGYLHLVNEDQVTIELGTWSAATLRQCSAVYDRHYPISEAGVWADSARHRRACIHNDYGALQDRRGLPEGHVALVRHLGVPVLAEGRVVLLAGVGNKADDYDDEDLACCQAIAEGAWRLMERRREFEALEVSRQKLLEIEALASISIWEWDPEDRVFTCDENVRRIFALEGSGPIGPSREGLLRLVDPRDRASMLDALDETGPDESFGFDLRGLRADGARITLNFRGEACVRPRGPGYVLRGILQDVTEWRELGRIHHLARHDALTGLANRAALIVELEAELRKRRRRPDDAFAVHFIDLDRFKPVNDRLGHAVGDAVLKRVADRLLRATRKADLVARLGGDELVVLQRHVASVEAAQALADKIIAAIGQPMEIGGHRVEVGASVGIAVPLPVDETAQALLARADRAMYRAKRERDGGYCVA